MFSDESQCCFGSGAAKLTRYAFISQKEFAALVDISHRAWNPGPLRDFDVSQLAGGQVEVPQEGDQEGDM